MKHLKKLMNILEEQAIQQRDRMYNYAIPQAWNSYGYTSARTLKSREILINPYGFYAYTLRHMFKKEDGNWKKATPFNTTKTDRSWIKEACIYATMIRVLGSWDHDRDDSIDVDNLFHLRDQGTFLKAIALLPSIQRMGINTILLHQPLSLGKSAYGHMYPKKEAVCDFRNIQEELKDPLIPEMSANEQCAAFVEACHQFGMRVIMEYCPGRLARENTYISEHPEWFYWIDADKEEAYLPPECNALPQNTIPYSYTLRDFYRSSSVKEHISIFTKAPKPLEKATLLDYIKSEHKTIAPYISDQINAKIPADKETTVLRFYKKGHPLVPEEVSQSAQPYITQDILRADLHKGESPMTSLWDMLCDNINFYQKQFGIDGIYLSKTFLIPEDLQVKMIEKARSIQENFVMIAEDAIVENSKLWAMKGFDAISGNSGYVEADVESYKFHDVAYHLKGYDLPLLAASEFSDAKRISAHNNGNQMAITLTVMNHFLPNGIPYLLNGIECFETQPLQLSEYGNLQLLNTLGLDDLRHHRQPYVDPYYFNYRNDSLSILPNILSEISKLRTQYINAICDETKCIPVWFDSPQDYGVGYTYIEEDKALMVVCSVQMQEHTHLHIHTENMLCELPFTPSQILQIYSTSNPYTHNVELDTFQNIGMDFTPGEVKFIEFRK